MKQFIDNVVVRNFKKIPYFFEPKETHLVEQSGYALMGKLSASLLHDILTPLTSLGLSSSLNGIQPSILTPLIKHSTDQIQEYIHIMKNFLNENPTDTLLHVNSEILNCITLLKHKALASGVQIQFVELDQVYASIYPLHMYQIIINLLANAIEASEHTESKKIILIIKKEYETFWIECKDFGMGMSQETLDKIGHSNFSTKSCTRGFGLYSVKHIIEKILNGKLIIQSEPDNGSLFSCILPLLK
jgi:two-component system sporulation sensor kinase B